MKVINELFETLVVSGGVDASKKPAEGQGPTKEGDAQQGIRYSEDLTLFVSSLSFDVDESDLMVRLAYAINSALSARRSQHQIDAGQISCGSVRNLVCLLLTQRGHAL